MTRYLKWALAQKFKEYLLYQECVVVKDHSPLCHLQNCDLGATEQRWISALSSFDYKVIYRNDILREFDRLCFRDGNVLARKVVDPVFGEIYQYVIPEKHRTNLVNTAHSWGHSGRDKTFSLLRQRVWWPKMYADIASFVKGCESCIRANGPR